MSGSHYLPRTFTCICGHDHELLDDGDLWANQDGDIVGQTACMLAAGRITPEAATLEQCVAANRDGGGRCQRKATYNHRCRHHVDWVGP